MKPSKILIFGKGQLGTLYREWYEDRGINVFVADVDIRNAEAVIKIVEETRPDLIINTAAKTSIDWCEENKEECFAVNTLGADNIASAAEKGGIYLVHISSGCVQESLTESDIKTEDDKPNPLCFYAWTKVWAENLIEDRIERGNLSALILRPRQLLSSAASNRNALVKMLTYTKFIDTPNSCTVVEDLIDVTSKLVEKDVLGLVNVVNPGVTSPLKIAKVLREIIKPDMQIQEISKAELNKMTKAKRIDCVLSDERLDSLGLKLGSLEIRLPEVVIGLKKNLEDNNSVLELTAEETQKKLKT
jgi:dTDP-4-dehydrorhamnose reductase